MTLVYVQIAVLLVVSACVDYHTMTKSAMGILLQNNECNASAALELCWDECMHLVWVH